VKLVDVSCHWWKDAENSENYSVAHRGNCARKQKALARLSQIPMASVTGGMSSSVCHHRNPPAPSGRASWHRLSSILATTSLLWRMRPQAAPPSMIFHREIPRPTGRQNLHDAFGGRCSCGWLADNFSRLAIFWWLLLVHFRM
jgi:hypothetical protein